MPAKINQLEAAMHLTMAANEGRVVGRVTGATLEEPFYFADLGQLVLALDTIYDRRNYPQAYQRARSFTPKPPVVPAVPPVELPANAETLVLSVLSRRSSTWQGFVTWADGSRASFVSTLALLRLISDHFGL